MPKISLTSFVDFVSKAGTPKLTVVKNVKQQDAVDYVPATDFYKVIREEIIVMHKNGRPKADLDALLTSLPDKKKQTAYPPIVTGYKKFLGNKSVAWFDPPHSLWSHAGLDVRVNPELGLVINETRHVIKLYFKAEELAKLRTDISTQLMELVLKNAKKPAQFALLDVRRSKLFSSNGVDPGLTALLKGEAASFAQVYASV